MSRNTTLTNLRQQIGDARKEIESEKKQIRDIIQFNKSQRSENETTPLMINDDPENQSNQNTLSCIEKITHCGKMAFEKIILFNRAGSCLYRAVVVSDCVILFCKIPGLNQWDGSENTLIIADLIGIVFGIADMIQTIKKSKKSIHTLCMHPDWVEGLHSFGKDICAGKYEKKLLLFAIPLILSSATKGIVGFQNVVDRAAQFPYMEFLNYSRPYAYLIGVSSSFCSIAFQCLEQALWVIRCFQKFKTTADMENFIKTHKNWDRFTTFIGYTMAFFGALMGAIAVFYENHEFQFSALTIFLFFISAFSTLFNFTYGPNPVYRLESIAGHNERDCDNCKEVNSVENPDEEDERFHFFRKNARRVVNFFRESTVVDVVGSAGGAISFSPTLIRSVQVFLYLLSRATRNDRYYELSHNSWFIFVGFILSIPLLCFSFLQTMGMWGKSKVGKNNDVLQDEHSIVNEPIRLN
ncbi:MAG: hypothetical protein A3C44_04580 [Gammaproteobacteria bacterium RIFCSPHIGHO2_02_FULL_39_13]|nr:MAG: hypothetical protein A3C44_04580 [Gammaproteobacteria bacterium RIFCSPHIGHO2_02_FULL_39_13]